MQSYDAHNERRAVVKSQRNHCPFNVDICANAQSETKRSYADTLQRVIKHFPSKAFDFIHSNVSQVSRPAPVMFCSISDGGRRATQDCDLQSVRYELIAFLVFLQVIVWRFYVSGPIGAVG